MLPLVLAAAAFSATPATLTATLAKAGCGDKVTLRPGHYGEVVLSNRSCASPMVLDTRSAKLALRVQNVEGLTIHGGTFDADASANRRGVSIDASARVQLIGARVDGAADAIMVARSSDVTVRNAVTSRVIGNNLTIAGSQRVSVRGLVCRDATPDPSGAIHPDCVQAWSLPDRKTTDVLITGVDMIGPTQGIFFGEEPGGYERITIFYNRIVGKDAPNGISIRNSCRDCVVASNHVSTMAGSKWQTTIYSTDPGITQRHNLIEAFKAPRPTKPRSTAAVTASSAMALPDRASAPIVSAVPEPATWALLAGGVGAIGAALRRRRANPVGRAPRIAFAGRGC